MSLEISSQVENGLFSLTGLGLIPWRVIDTYRMFLFHSPHEQLLIGEIGAAKIWHLRVETHKRRQAQGLPPIQDPNDLPDPKEAKDYISVSLRRYLPEQRDEGCDEDPGTRIRKSGVRGRAMLTKTQVLSEKEQAELEYQQHKFATSQTWYRPHATATHRAFPIKWALWNTVVSSYQSRVSVCQSIG